MPRLPVPSQLGSFEIQQLIGAGLTGEVYKARYRDGTIVALKICLREQDRTVFGYFTNEQMLLREIALNRRHPHIVEYITSNLVQPPFYLATRLVEGAQDLASQIKGPLPAAFVVRVVTQIAGALDYLHTGHPTFSPIIHRDVKPHNILIDADGNAVLIDLSIASHPHYALEDERGLGTPGYMAPEQYSGEEVPATDQFALAMVTLHMLTGRALLPDRGTAALRRLKQISETHYAEVTESLGKRIHTADVLVRALAYDPANRYESCEVFADRLRHALVQDGEQVAAPPVRRTGVSEQPASASPLPWIAVGIATVVALVVLVMALVAGSPPTPQAQPTSAVPAVVQVTPMGSPTLVPARTPQTILQPARPNSTLSPATGVPDTGGSLRVQQREPLRQSPSTQARILTWMPEGTLAEPTGNQQAEGSFVWYEVRFNGQTGWCRSLYCIPK